MHIDKRLETIANLVPQGCVLADIGTDHAYLPVWLLEKQRIARADGESSYHIQVNMSDFESYLIRMVFYDRYENEAGTLIIREPEMDFKCPLKTYSYRVQLINAGGTKMHFHSFVITEKEG